MDCELFFLAPPLSEALPKHNRFVSLGEIEEHNQKPLHRLGYNGQALGYGYYET